MLTLERVLEWLNWERNSLLSDRMSFWVWLIRETSTPEDEKKDTAESLVKLSYKSGNLLEQAEVLVNCAIFQLQHSQCEEAVRLFFISRQIYETKKDLHRQAVVECLLHLTYHAQGRYLLSLSWALQSRKILSEFASLRAKHGYHSQERWYREKALEITTHLVETPDYVYEWLTEFSASRLGATAQDLKEQIRDLLDQHLYLEANEKTQLLLELARKTSDPAEEMEALSLRALTRLSVGKQQEAIELFRLAKALASPGSHQYTLVQWMLGIVQYQDRSLQLEAIKNMESSLEKIKYLCQTADHQNRIRDCLWYQALEDAMKRVIEQALSLAA